MLEHRVLLIRPDTPLSMQIIVDGDSGTVLGSARWEPESSSWWRRLFGRRVLAVREQEEEPLLLTIRRCWNWPLRRCVYDAEDKPVGSLLGSFIYDNYGDLLAVLENGVFRASGWRILAELDSTTEGWRLTFSETVAGEPFLKMLLLSAALTRPFVR